MSLGIPHFGNPKGPINREGPQTFVSKSCLRFFDIFLSSVVVYESQTLVGARPQHGEFGFAVRMLLKLRNRYL